MPGGRWPNSRTITYIYKPMKEHITTLIEEWFSVHDGDGEFALHARSVPYSVIGPSGSGSVLLFTTKPAPVWASISGLNGHRHFGLIGGSGLPSASDVTWIRAVQSSRPLAFLGDMDPVDLMIYAWLRARLYPTAVAYLGLGDAILGAADPSILRHSQLALTHSERGAVTLLQKVFPDCQETVGLGCFKFLEDGFKIEVDSILHMDGVAAAIVGNRSGPGHDRAFGE